MSSKLLPSISPRALYTRTLRRPTITTHFVRHHSRSSHHPTFFLGFTCLSISSTRRRHTMALGFGSDLDMDLSFVVFASLGLVITQVLWSYFTPQPYHPGPRRVPLIGNALQIPRKTPWISYKQWSKIYGPCIHLDVVGLHVLILNEYKDAEELLGKRGTAYAERPHLVMAGDLVGFGRGLALLPYDKDGKESRRMILNTVGARNVPDHKALLEKETLRYLRGIRDTPERAVAHLTYSAGAIILKIAYGYSVQPTGDPLVTLANDALDKFSQTTLLGEFPVDIFPILRHVPSWVPGVKFKKLAREWKQLGIDLFDKPFDYVKSQMIQGTAVPSFSSHQLEQLSEWNDHVIGSRAEVVKATATSLYAGASDTTVSAMRSFYLAMTIYPDIQVKARAEIEAVVGSNRLPALGDRANLPYCNRLIKEVLRWGVVGPLGIPHLAAKDDEYQGYKIPKGTIIVANIWAMLHDETKYPDPERFNPDRFLDPSQPDPAHMSFGFGRRICPGLHFAQAALFLSITQTLALFQIKRALKENGEEEIPEAKFITGMISHPESFRFNVVPLSAEHMKLIDENST